MRHSIAYYIREQLREDRSVYIPGLGSFVLEHSPATISSDRQSIDPPTVSLLFDEKEGDETPLLQRISIIEDTTVKKAKKQLSKFTESIFNRLININRAEIPGIGKLIRKEDESIIFEDTIEDLTDGYHRLQSLPLTPIKRMERNNQSGQKGNDKQPSSKVPPTAENNYGIENMATSPSYVEEPRSRAWLIPLIGGLLLFLAYLLFTKGCDSTSNIVDDGNIDDVEQIANGEANIDATDSITDVDLSIDKVETEVDNIIANGATAIEGSSETNTPDIIDVKKPSSNSKTVINGDSRDNTTTKATVGNSVIQSVSYDGERCVIIVGSFKKARNVLKMKNKVENMGYKVYTQDYKDYTRVGLEFSCLESELDAYIAEARSKIESQAWYLEAPGK